FRTCSFFHSVLRPVFKTDYVHLMRTRITRQMARIHDLINELKELKPGNARKSAFDIYNLLENNAALFLQYVDADQFHLLRANFESLAYATAKDFSSSSYRDDVEKNYNLLSFYLDKVI
ncbi:MAG: hypothetical protein ACXVP0_04350, partial [Bacteroidia bacterium]